MQWGEHLLNQISCYNELAFSRKIICNYIFVAIQFLSNDSDWLVFMQNNFFSENLDSVNPL